MWPGQNVELPLVLRRVSADALFYPAYDPPVLGRTPTVITVHDLTPLTLPGYFERLNTLKRSYVRAVVGRGVSRARRVLAVSEASKATVRLLFGDAAANKTVVVHNGAPPISNLVRSPRALLYVGTDRPHKNLPSLIRAYAVARKIVSEMPPLHLAGGFRNRESIEAQIAQQGLSRHVFVRGHLDDSQLKESYRSAVAVVFPSLAEGFGFPIVEAMANGVPVVTSDVSACAEVAGDAAVLVDPFSVESIARGLVRICADHALASQLTDKGFRRVRFFDWNRAGRETAEVINAAFELRSD